MINLQTCEPTEVRAFARELFMEYRDQLASFQEAAQTAVEVIQSEFCDEYDEPIFALLRIFRLGHFEDIPPRKQYIANQDVPFWFVLAGTTGINDAWCDIEQSQSHQVIPADEEMTPMLRAALDQIDIQPRVDSSLAQHRADSLTRYFYIPKALGNDAIHAQDDFVIPYEIESVVGLGGYCISGSALLLVGFSRQFLDEECVQRFSELSPFLVTLLAAYDGRGRLWD